MKKIIDPRMHSAEHILNRTMDRLFGCGRSFNAHIEKKKSKCDYRFDRPLTERELDQIQNRVNRVIQDDLPVSESFLSTSDAEKMYNLNKLPGNSGDTVRIVHIGAYDACPCSGRHVASTADVGKFRITSASFDRGVLRIRFRLSPARGS
jgi:alanyl-tRNA synthetase